MARFIFISGGDDHQVHLREWQMEKNMSKNFVLHEEFEECLESYRVAGKYVSVDEWSGEPNEVLLHAI